MKKSILLITLLMAALNVQAAKAPRDGALDSRIKKLEYRSDQVYKLHTHYLQDTLIMFDENETIMHLGAGDPVAWQIVPVSNYLSVKPIEDKADTNLNILTKHNITGAVRSYSFELNAGEAKSVKDKSSSFMVKFSYPEDELKLKLAALSQQKRQRKTEVVAGRKTSADQWNMDYTYAGHESSAPVRVFDDGEFTYFQFPKNIDVPAIFLVDEYNNESLVNHHVSGKYIVVQRIGGQFILRDGKKATCIFNKAYGAQNEQTMLAQDIEFIESMSDDSEE